MRAPSLAAEPLEPRAMLAVSATLSGGDLLITYNAPGDLLADISSDGTDYTVTGTGLAATKFNVADVTGVISVADNAAQGGQQFKVLAGTALANPLQINANVEIATLTGGITATKAGDVLIGSAAITLANDISTWATDDDIAFMGVVTLAKNTTIGAGFGAITFNGRVDGAFTLAAYSIAATTFGGVVGGTTPLVSLATSFGTVSLLSVTTIGAQTYKNDTVTLNGTYTTTNSNFTVDKVTTLTGNSVVSTGTGNIAFNGTVDGGFSLTANSTGTTTFGESVGSATPLARLATSDGGTTEIGTFAISDVAITTTAAAGVVFNDAVTLAKNTTIDAGAGAVTLASTVTAARTVSTAVQAGGTDAAGRGIAVLPDGSSVVTGSFGGTATFGSTTLTSDEFDVFIAKLDAAGSFVWAAQAGGYSSGIAVLPDGSSVVTGSFGGTATFGSTTLTSSGRSDVFVAKLDAVGNFEWAAQAGGTDLVFGHGLAVLPDGSSVVTGDFSGTATFGSTTLTSDGVFPVFVAKLDAAGNFVWAAQAGGTNLDSYGLAVLPDGSSVVTGEFQGTATFGSTTLTSSGSRDVFVAKLNAAGNFVWAAQAGATGNSFGRGIAVLPDGSSVVTGDFSGTATFGSTTLTSSGRSDVFVAKLDAVGNFEWAAQAGGTDLVFAYGLAVLPDGSSVVTGYFQGTAAFGSTTLTGDGVFPVFVAKLDAAGNFVWAAQAGATGNSFGRGIAVLPDGSSVVTGDLSGTVAFGSTTLTSDGAEDVFVAKLDAAGNWTAFDESAPYATLTIRSSGTTEFRGAVTDLGSLVTDAGGTTVIAGGAIKTTGADGQVFGDAVTLGADTTLTAATGTIDFKKTLDGGYTLTVADATDVFFRGKVGSTDPLAGITLQKADSVTSEDTITLDGTPALATDGITIAAGVNNVSLTKDGSTIRNFSGNGILFKGGSTDTIISGFTIEANGGDGVRFEAGSYSGTTISKNSISGNDGNGVRLTAATGPVSIADNVQIDLNSLNGVYAENSTTVSIASNSIGGNKNHGVSVFGGGGVIYGNGIVDNVFNGVLLAGGYDVAGNLIENNGLNGIQVATGLTNLDITGNTITANDLDGILFDTGGVTGFDVSDNAIYANKSDGIQADAGSYTGTTIAGNTIRDNGNPTAHVGNGILVEGSNLMIGWTATAGQPNTVANTITGNALNGIEIRGAAAQNNTILSNSIFLNGYTAAGMVVGDGIALVDGGNGALPSPRILRAVADAATDTIRVQVVVPAAGSYYVQLFANTAVDERGLVPVDVNGFEGRSYVGDSPAQSGSPVTAGKPAIAGTPIAGNTVAVIEMPADRVPAGGWLTATATAVEAGVAGATSGFSAAVQLPNAPVLAVGSDGPAVWVPHYNYRALSGNVLRLGGLTVTEVNRLVAMRGRQIFISANGRSEVATATVANVRRIGRTAVNIVLRNITSPEGSLAGTAGRLEPGPLTLPTARLYDAATGEVVLDVGAEAIAASLQAAGVAPVAADAFVSRFQGGLRVASGDVDGDGFAELVTAPGAAPAIPAATFGNATRIITIYSGNPAAAWQSASLNVTAAFPGYSGGFQVTLGDVLPEAPGDGSGVLELIVAGTNKVAVYELTITERGAAPEIAATPAAEWAIGPRFRITGLAAGDFSAAASDSVVVATAGPAGTVVRTFSVADGSFAAQSTFRARSYVQGDPQRRLRDVFARGASLAVGDIDGAADGKPELVLAAAAQGLANFRVLANDLVTGGTQRAIDTALAVGNGFTQQSRSQYAVVNGRRVWQPAGGPDYFAGMSRLTNAFALGINAPLSVAVVNATGATAAGQVFAALGPQNATSNMIRQLAWSSLEASWSGTDAFQAQPNGRTRFPLGGGLLLG